MLRSGSSLCPRWACTGLLLLLASTAAAAGPAVAVPSPAAGTLADPIIDSRTTLAAEQQKALARGFPRPVVERQALVEVKYLSFDNQIHQGQLLVDRRLVGDVTSLFARMRQERFPIRSVIPISHFDWDDHRSMASNNTSGFNYRTISGTHRMSHHAQGQAVDINPIQNPYVTGARVSPPGARYQVGTRGTLGGGSPQVRQFKALGWAWGGDWKRAKDYQHFEKVLD